MEKWRCTVCGYIHEGPMTQDFTCPRCKQPASAFVPVEDEKSDSRSKYAGTKTEKISKKRFPARVRRAINIHSLPQSHSTKDMSSWQSCS